MDEEAQPRLPEKGGPLFAVPVLCCWDLCWAACWDGNVVDVVPGDAQPWTLTCCPPAEPLLRPPSASAGAVARGTLARELVEAVAARQQGK